MPLGAGLMVSGSLSLSGKSQIAKDKSCTCRLHNLQFYSNHMQQQLILAGEETEGQKSTKKQVKPTNTDDLKSPHAVMRVKDPQAPSIVPLK